ncbi:MAG: phosphosulfolactate synthase [Balneolales bacterium]
MIFELNGLPKRAEKQRDNGITLVLDKGYSIRQTEDFIETSSDFVDIVKFGWGTGYITPHFEEKVLTYQNAGIPIFLGGTMFEAFYLRNQLDDYLRMLEHYGIGHVEVSDGIISLSHDRKLAIIEELQKNFIVLSEVGSKNPSEVMPSNQWVEMIQSEIEAGAWKVICEARETGNVGIFHSNGETRSELIDEISLQISPADLIFEAPKKTQQVWFLKKFGSNVNLGNICCDEVITLETLRLGLRGDTLLDFYIPQGQSNRVKTDDI